jgi:hypothetical protein
MKAFRWGTKKTAAVHCWHDDDDSYYLIKNNQQK